MDHKTEKLVEQVLNALPESAKLIGGDLQLALKTALSELFASMEVVTREEFDAQKAVLARSRERLEQMQAQLDALQKESDAADTHR